MKYDLKIQSERFAATSYFTTLVKKEQLIEIKKVSPIRSLNQNSYLHMLLSDFGQHFGYTLEEAKTIYKRDINPGIYVYTKNDSKFLRTSADLTTEEMAASIDKLREQSANLGYPLPAATDQGWLREVENEIERTKYVRR